MSTRLERLAEDFIRGYFGFFSHAGSEKGYTAVDALPVVFERDKVEELRRLFAASAEQLSAARGYPGLDADDNVDLRVLDAVIRLGEFWLGELRVLDSMPHAYVEAALESIESLRLREAGGEYIPTDCYVARLRGVRDQLDAAAANLAEPMRMSVRVALEMARHGAAELEHDTELGTKGGAARDGLASAAAALREFTRWLDGRRDKTRPFEPVGRACYERLLVAEHGLTEGVAFWQDEAERFLEQTDDLARTPAPEPARRLEDYFPSGISREQVFSFLGSELELLRQMLDRRRVLTVPEGALVLAPAPLFASAAHAGASYHPPPSFSHSHTGFFFVPQVPERLGREDIARFRERFEERSFLTLAVHEAYPGHHVQFLHAMDHPRPLRKFRDFDIFVEGWAHYCEQMMWEEALRDEPGCRFPLRSLRFRALRVLVDSALHCGDLSPAAAARFMAARLHVEQGPWFEREVERYALAPGQAFSYFAGKRVIERLRTRAQARERTAFDLRRFHDALLGHGSIPVQFVEAESRISKESHQE